MSEGDDLTILKADDVASVICARSDVSPTSMKLQKLLYYAQAWHLAVTDRPLFSEAVKAYRDGPVVPEVRWARMDPDSRRPAVQNVDHINLDDISSRLIDLVLANYGAKSGDELSVLTHDELPWRQARGDLPDGVAGNDPIPQASMADFYRSNGKLGGRTAVDLAVGGVWPEAADTAYTPVDVDALLRDLPEFEAADPWGGANLHVRLESPRRRLPSSSRQAR